MIETTQRVPVGVAIDRTWDYVRDIRRWAELMPGLQDCEIIDEDDSRWILKVGVGGMVRTVKVDVHVDEWDGPERVFFSFKLQGDPVKGGGSYLATPTGPDTMEMTLSLQVEGSGPMAPMWEAMGGPMLPKFAKSFAEQLRDRIEAIAGGATLEELNAPKPGLWARFMAWLRGLLGA